MTTNKKFIGGGRPNKWPENWEKIKGDPSLILDLDIWMEEIKKTFNLAPKPEDEPFVYNFYFLCYLRREIEALKLQINELEARKPGAVISRTEVVKETSYLDSVFKELISKQINELTNLINNRISDSDNKNTVRIKEEGSPQISEKSQTGIIKNRVNTDNHSGKGRLNNGFKKKKNKKSWFSLSERLPKETSSQLKDLSASKETTA